MRKIHVPLERKVVLAIAEAAEYFEMDEEDIRSFALDRDQPYVLWSGRVRRIKRKQFEELINKLNHWD